MAQKRTITLANLDLSITYSVKDNSVRGCHTERGYNLKVGDKIVLDNYFHEIVEETETPASTTEEETTAPEAPAPTETETRTETNNITTRDEIVAKIIAFFEENPDIFNDCMTELDNYNGYLGDDRVVPMEWFDDYFGGLTPIEIATRVYYGRDEWGDTFNPNRDYFYFNGYGNPVSCDCVDYSDHLDEYAIDAMTLHRDCIDAIDECDDLARLFNELEQIDEGGKA